MTATATRRRHLAAVVDLAEYRSHPSWCNRSHGGAPHEMFTGMAKSDAGLVAVHVAQDDGGLPELRLTRVAANGDLVLRFDARALAELVTAIGIAGAYVAPRQAVTG